jgi:hypothetical protein
MRREEWAEEDEEKEEKEKNICQLYTIFPSGTN